MKACGVFEKFTSHIAPRFKKYSRDELLEIIKNAKNKSEIVNRGDVYSQLNKSKDRELMEEYRKIPRKTQSKI